MLRLSFRDRIGLCFLPFASSPLASGPAVTPGTEQVLLVLNSGAELFGCGCSFQAYTAGLCILLMHEHIAWILCLKGEFVINKKQRKRKVRKGSLSPCGFKGTKPTCSTLPWARKEAESSGKSISAMAVISLHLHTDFDRVKSQRASRCQGQVPTTSTSLPKGEQAA